MLATDKQIKYLQALAKKVDAIQKSAPDILTTPVPRRDWHEERRRGMTTADASIRIKAYKDIIFFANVKRTLLGRPQF